MKKQVEVSIKDLHKLRIACQGKRGDGKPCAAVIELPMESVDGFFPKDECKCPWCGTRFYGEVEGERFVNPFKSLAESFGRLSAIDKKVVVTFVINGVESEPNAQDKSKSN